VTQEQTEGGRPLLGFETSIAHPARVWNYWVGGKDHFAADRETGKLVMEAMPYMPLVARLARRFLADAVRRLAGDYGIRQFLDIGTGLPTAENTHEVAQRIAPQARIVYVDNDPIVLTHARALLTSSAEGRTDYIAADLRDPDLILAAAERTLDFSQPVAVLLIGVLHFVPDRDDPFGTVARLMSAVPSGSFLVVGHASSDQQAEAAAEGSRRYNDKSVAPITMRSRDQVARFFDGLEMLEPGFVSMGDWWPEDQRDAEAASAMPGSGYVGIGRKP
jgi:O-methyltransferase involved in polyketide biosynthesis